MIQNNDAKYSENITSIPIIFYTWLFYIWIVIFIFMYFKTRSPKLSEIYKKIKPIFVENFNVEKLAFTQFDPRFKNDININQNLAWPRYNNEPRVLIQTQEIQLTQYGFPMGAGCKFPMEDSKRNYIKIPLDPHQPACVLLENKLSEIDEYILYNRSHFMKGIEDEEQYVYKPVIRDPIINYDEVLGKPKYRSIKARFETTYPDGIITTQLYVKNALGIATKVEVRTASDLDKYLRWNCKIRLILSIGKLFADKYENPQTHVKNFGIMFKIAQIEIDP
jgi:hypothetical protein